MIGLSGTGVVLLDEVSGGSGRDRLEKPILRAEEEGTVGKQRPRGRENEEGFSTDDAAATSEPDDTPEDVEDDDEPEFCQLINQSINQSVSS